MSPQLRNIAIIAHVDHGKTTLVDHLLKQSGTFQAHQEVEDRMMDSMDLERERGITIAAKNASFIYKDVKVNIVDTPGHSDFGGEVERILDMVDGAILLVDSSEGPLPQTRFVLKKALEKNLKLLLCINKIDRPDSRINEVENETFDLFIDLDATDEQTEFETIYAIARDGIATKDPEKLTNSLEVLLDWIVDNMPAPNVVQDAPLQMMISNISYNNFVGRLAIGRVRAGSMKVGDQVLISQENKDNKFKITALFQYKASELLPVDEIHAGDIAVVAGFEDIYIGDTITSLENPQPLPRIKVDEPTVGVMISINDGPFAGLDGKMVTSRKVKERLDKELLHNVALKLEDTASTDTWKLLARGELQIAVLAEQMRREGYEFLISKPQVVFKEENGKKMEPMEEVVVDVEEAYMGTVTEKLGKRKGILTGMDNKGSGRVRSVFRIPSRGLIGYRSEFLTDTRGTGLLNTYYGGYEEYKGDIQGRNTGSMISDRKGKATSYALANLEDRGKFFIKPGTEVYQGMIVGEHNKSNNLEVNLTREKKLTNVRASGTDENVKLAPVQPISIERALEWINDDELIEITPNNVRLRSRYLDPNLRRQHEKKQKS
ncbi:MAG: translational GTPase TypA [Bdellovibrionales bacterium]|nr:translational GTPase TypA [Bdellovibrionales bacterium]